MAGPLKRIALGVGGLVVLGIAAVAAVYGPAIYRVAVGLHRYETAPVQLPVDLKDPAVLVFSKTNGARHEESISAGNRFFADLTARRGWSAYFTESGGVFNVSVQPPHLPLALHVM